MKSPDASTERLSTVSSPYMVYVKQSFDEFFYIFLGDYTYLRINFYHPGAAVGKDGFNFATTPDATFLKELTFRSTNTKVNLFSNFSCMFLIPNNFFQF